VFDGAHNPNALRALFETALNLGILGDVVYSGFKDKEQLENLKEVASYLERSGGQLFLVPLEGPRALSTDELFSLAERAGVPRNKLRKIEKIDLKKLRRPTIITGSFYLGGLIERG
jgi:dihydrofolate synthase/folylpolyglutamate synthase